LSVSSNSSRRWATVWSISPVVGFAAITLVTGNIVVHIDVGGPAYLVGAAVGRAGGRISMSTTPDIGSYIGVKNPEIEAIA
jgi:mannose/fructose/N-acetylgalactosamine-specific phosphotransferase system component IIC